MGAASLYTAFIEIGFKGFDKVDKHMMEAARIVDSKMSAIGQSMKAGQAAMTDFVRAGSPVAFNTLGGSIELLKARIGSAFTPVVMAASKSIQDLSHWIKNLDPETKKTIATWTAIGVVGTGLALTVGNLALKVATLGVTMAGFAINHPLVVLLGLMSTAAYMAWKNMSNLDDKMKSMIETTKRLNNGDINQDDINKSYIGKDLSTTEDAGKRKKKAEQYLKISEDRKAQLMSEVGDYGDGDNNSAMAGYDRLGIAGALNLPEGGQLKRQQEELEQLHRDIALAKQFIAAGDKGKKLDIKDSPSKANNDFSIASMKSSPYASSGAKSLDSAYSSLNNMALGQDDIQRKILQEQQLANMQALQQSKKVEGIFDMLSNATGR